MPPDWFVLFTCLIFFPSLSLESFLGGGVDPWPHSDGGSGELHRGGASLAARPRSRRCGNHHENRDGDPGGEVKTAKSIGEDYHLPIQWCGVFWSTFKAIFHRFPTVNEQELEKKVLYKQNILLKAASSDVRLVKNQWSLTIT